MNIGQQIANRRKLLGLTQRNLADTLHVSFQAISKWENGTTFPDVTLLAPLARVLRTSVDALVDHRPALTDYEQRYQCIYVPRQHCRLSDLAFFRKQA